MHRQTLTPYTIYKRRNFDVVRGNISGYGLKFQVGLIGILREINVKKTIIKTKEGLLLEALLNY